MTEPHLEITTRHAPDGRHQVTLLGALDVGSAAHLERVLTWILDTAGAREVVIDMSGLRYLGASGVQALVKAAQTAATRDIMLSARNPQGVVDTTLRLTDAADLLHLPASALDAVTDAIGHSVADQGVAGVEVTPRHCS